MFRAGLIGIVSAFVFAVFLIGGGVYTVDQGERAVVTRNGRVIDEVGAGMHFKLPIFDNIYKMSIRTEKVTWEGDSAIMVYSRDIQQATVRLSVAYRLSPDVVTKTYSTAGTNYAEKLLWPAVQRRVKETTGQIAAADIIGKRNEMAATVLTLLNEDMHPRGIIVEAVQFENIDFSNTYEAAAEAAAQAEAAVRQKRQELEQVKIEAQKQIANAEAAAQAKRATADADAYAVRAAADADAHRLKVQGEARAEALREQVRALGTPEAVVQNNAILVWDGKLPATQVPGAAVPFVQVK